MRVAFVAWQPLAGLDTGYTRRVHSLAAHMEGVEVAVVSPPPRVTASFAHLVVRPSAFGRIPTLSGAPVLGYRLPAGRLRVHRALETLRPDVIHSEGIWPFPAVRRYAVGAHVPVVVTIHNLEHRVAQRSGRAACAARVLYLLERAAYSRADLLVCMSEVDRDYVVQTMGIGTAQVIVVPNGASPPDSGPDDTDATVLDVGGPVVLFMGKLDYRPNAQALRFLLDGVYPVVSESVPEVVFVVVGAPKPTTLPRGVLAVGRVPSVWPYLLAADVCVAPLQSGSGTRLKILEYLAAGRPVVSTSVGIEGLDVTSGRDLLVADELQLFAQAVVRLLRNPDEARALGVAGRRLVERQYRWDDIARRYADELRSRFGGGR
jgi:glycosyltransferase involved in cell wall biosynthesis